MLPLRRIAPAVMIMVLTAVLLPGVQAPAATEAFPHGVAARAYTTSATIWTRAADPGDYRFQVARDKGFDDVVDKGSVTASEDEDLTLKVKVKDLKKSKRYFYRFTSEDGDRSDRGRFETLPDPDSPAALSLALTGDSDIYWQDNPDPASTDFEVLERVREENPDLFIFMGDTIYSDSETGLPPALTLEEKWQKYKDNRIQPTQELLEAVSTWALWDDHEVINDFDGAVLENTDPALLAAGRDAFNDYWPVQESRYYRRVSYGSKIDLFFLDERSYRTQSADEVDSPCRDQEGNLDLAPTMPEDDRAGLGLPPVAPECLTHINDPNRTMLGAEQLDWLKKGLNRSDARWKLIVNEVTITQLFAQPYDRWEGYAAERAELLGFIHDKDLDGVVFLTTDLHANIGSRVFMDIASPDGQITPAYEAVVGPIQTCSLDCEIDALLGSDGSGEFLKSYLNSHGLTDPEADCQEIDTYAYAMVSTNEKAKKLKIRWRSGRPAPGDGGEPIEFCDNAVLLP